MKEACTQTTDKEAVSVVACMASHISCHLQDLYTQNMLGFIYESIHLLQSTFYVSLPFTILMTLQQSMVAERGREPGGFPSERAESILLGKGAKSVVVVMPDSIFLGHRYSRTTPPFLLSSCCHSTSVRTRSSVLSPLQMNICVERTV